MKGGRGEFDQEGEGEQGKDEGSRGFREGCPEVWTRVERAVLDSQER